MGDDMKKREIAFVLSLTLACIGPAAARLWNPTPVEMAQDYSSIVHNKGPAGGRVLIQWLSAPGFPAGAMQATFDKYVVIIVGHTTTSPAGTMEHHEIGAVEVTGLSGEALKEIPPNDIPPGIVGMLAGLEATMRQSSQGRGKMKSLVFVGTTVRACEKDGLAVTYAGERYVFETPMPGCVKP
jgi:hypothetical protein